MRKRRVFVDSSVMVAALLSPTGGSSHILNNLCGSFAFETNEYAITEMKEAFSKKFKDNRLANKLHILIGLSGMRVLSDPDPTIVTRMEKYVPSNDATILASAMIKNDCLLTLDKGFFKDSIVSFARKHKVSILKPKEFIEIYG
jgi:predicted nucleic acid-binding protein